MAAQSAQLKEMQEMMESMQAKRSGGGYVGRGRGGRGDGIKQETKTQAPNTASTPGCA